MGRAYEVRKASIQKTGDKKAKLYSIYAKEVYQAAKQGGIDESTNVELKRLIDKAKKEQVPSDIVKRALDKVKSGATDDYFTLKYEIIGPEGSTLIAECLTDNPNRSISEIRKVVNKKGAKLVDQGSISYLYDTVSQIIVKGVDEDQVLEKIIEDDIEIIDIKRNGNIIIYGDMKDLSKIRNSIISIKGIKFISEEIIMKSKVSLFIDESKIPDFIDLVSALENEDDVKKVYHNVENV